MTFRQIAQEVADKHGIAPADLMRQDRKANIIKARNELLWRSYHDLGWSYYRIAAKMGRDHTTIMHAVRQHEASVVTPDMQAMQRARLDRIWANVMEAVG